MRKWKQEIERLMKREGLEGIDWKTTGKNHQKATGSCTLCACDPPIRVVVVTSLTPSDHRTLQNIRGDIRRQLRAKCGTLQSA